MDRSKSVGGGGLASGLPFVPRVVGSACRERIAAWEALGAVGREPYDPGDLAGDECAILIPCPGRHGAEAGNVFASDRSVATATHPVRLNEFNGCGFQRRL